MTIEHPAGSIPAGCIVVGVDGSDHAELAVRWAAGLAAVEHRPLVLLHAAAGRGPDPVDRATELAGPGVRTLPVRTTGEPRAALLDASATAGVVVVGSRGLGPLRTLVLGSTSQAVSRCAECPTVVVRHPDAGSGVVVGIDGTADSDGALRFAYRMAAAWHEPLLVVHCFWERTDSAHGTPIGPRSTLEEQQVLVGEQLAGLAEDHPEVVVHTVLHRGFADRHLLREAQGRRLLVVGHRPVSPLQELVWGTLAPTVLEHATCDVAVVPAGCTQRPGAG